MDFDEIWYIVYWYGLVVPPLSMERIGAPLHVFLGGVKNRALLRASA